MYKVSLLTRDGATIAFDADPSDTLLDAAERASIYLPSSCREGGCGACRVARASGDVELMSYSSAALSEDERMAGDILLCRAQPRSDLALRAPFDEAAVGFAPVPERRATLVAMEPAGSGAVRLQLQYEDDPTFGRAAQFTAGQFIELTLPDGSAKRSYSLANAPNWDGTLELFIRLQPHGAFSNYLRDRAAVGDTLLVRGPQGQFTARRVERGAALVRRRRHRPRAGALDAAANGRIRRSALLPAVLRGQQSRRAFRARRDRGAQGGVAATRRDALRVEAGTGMARVRRHAGRSARAGAVERDRDGRTFTPAARRR